MPSLEEELAKMDDEELDALGVDLSDLDLEEADDDESLALDEDDLSDLDV
jgi:hypothetical protein